MERRQFARIPTELQLKFKSLEQLAGMVEAKAADLSLGGMFINTKHIKPVGTKVVIDLPLGDGITVMIDAEVRSIRRINDDPVGMGIKFLNLEEPALSVIKKMVGKNGNGG